MGYGIILSYLQVFQDEGTVFAEGLDQAADGGILGRDAVRDGRSDADDFLEHFDKGVVFVLAGFDLAGFHAEGGFEVHPLLPARRVSDVYGLFLVRREAKGREW